MGMRLDPGFFITLLTTQRHEMNKLGVDSNDLASIKAGVAKYASHLKVADDFAHHGR